MDDPNEVLSMQELILKIQTGDMDPSLLARETKIKIVEYCRSDPERAWKFVEIATLIGKDLRTVKRYWAAAKKKYSEAVDGEWLKKKMAEDAFEFQHQYGRLIRMSYSDKLSEGVKARIISLGLSSILRSSEQKWKQYYDRERIAEKKEAEAQIRAREEAVRKQKDAEKQRDDAPMAEMMNSIPPIDRTQMIMDTERLILAENKYYFTEKSFENDEKINELLEAIRGGDLGLTLNKDYSPIHQLIIILQTTKLPKICLESKKIEYNRLNNMSTDHWNSLLDRAIKEMAGKEYKQLSISERADLIELNRGILERIYGEKCPKSKDW